MDNQEKLIERLATFGYTAVEFLPGEDGLLMLHVNGAFICNAEYALSLDDKALQSLIAETLAVKEAENASSN